MRRLQKIQQTVVCNTTNNTIGTLTLNPISGYIRGIKIKAPATVDSAATLTSTIKDDDGDALPLASGFAGQAAAAVIKQFADTQTAPNQLEYPAAGALTITCTLNQTQSVARNVIVTLYVDSLI